MRDSYTGASSVSLNQATSTTYTYASSRDSGFNATFEVSAGTGADTPALAGVMEIEAPLGVGVGEVELAQVGGVKVSATASASFEAALSWLDDSSTAQGSTRSQVSTLALTGCTASPTSAGCWPRLGPTRRRWNKPWPPSTSPAATS